MAKEKTGEVALLGLVEAGRRLGLCAATVKAYADDGTIPMLRDSARRRLFFPADIEAFAQRRKVGNAKTHGKRA
jgi:predicted site-specific integrase-resolvase